MSEPKRYAKRLIEVDLPIKRVSAHARREKNIRHGHISTLHIWWARRPLAACRAVVCAALWPDPADAQCPERFRDEARRLMRRWSSDHLALIGPDSFTRFSHIRRKPEQLDDNLALRQALLDFIADFADWGNSTRKEYLTVSRALTTAAHRNSEDGASGGKPLIIDPFAGGGAIPLEALRVGADAFASELNPVAVLLNKVILDYVPRYGQCLADQLRVWGPWIKEKAQQDLAGLYPDDTNGSKPVSYLWARTIQCEGPGCGATIPLIRSLWLAKRSRGAVALRMIPDLETKNVSFEVIENASSGEVGGGTLRRGSATCPVCGYAIKGERVRAQFAGRRGGADDARLLCVVYERDGTKRYRLPREADHQAVQKARQLREKLEADGSSSDLSVIPDETLPYLRSIFNINLIDVTRWGDLFSARQAVAMAALSSALRAAADNIKKEQPELATAIITLLACAIDRQADYCTSICTWVQDGEFIGHNFAQGQSLPIKWDFAEVVPLSTGSGNWDGAIGWIARVVERLAQSDLSIGQVEEGSATKQVLPDDSADAFITDPPYYDSVPYADLSDFFYVWLKRTVGSLYPELLAGDLSPKREEIVQLAERNPNYSYKTKEHFETLLRNALTEGRRVTKPGGIGVFVFAHKETSAWETILQAVIDAGWVATASWPIDTEMGTRLRAKNAAALASSVHIVCRPRENEDGTASNHVGDWRDVLQELPIRIHHWMPRLQEEGVVGADAIFACLGPALEIFSRYSYVEKASGERVLLAEYMEHVWATVAREALSRVLEGADVSGIDPDARLTLMWLWTLSAGDSTNGRTIAEEEVSNAPLGTSGYALEYDAARKIAQSLGANLEKLRSVVQVKGDTARLLPVAERTKHLFGKEDSRVGKQKQHAQLIMFATTDGTDEQGEAGITDAPEAGATVLDRIHQSMLLFASGRGEALRRFLVEEGVGQDQRFWRLAQALSALYPSSSAEKRWVDGVLARKKGLGF